MTEFAFELFPHINCLCVYMCAFVCMHGCVFVSVGVDGHGRLRFVYEDLEEMGGWCAERL